MTDSRSAQWAGRGGAEWRGGRVPCAGCRGRGLAEEECREAAAVPLVAGADGRRPEPCWAAEPRRPSRPSCPTSARRCGARPGGRADGAAGLRGGLSRSRSPAGFPCGAEGGRSAVPSLVGGARCWRPGWSGRWARGFGSLPFSSFVLPTAAFREGWSWKRVLCACCLPRFPVVCVKITLYLPFSW